MYSIDSYFSLCRPLCKLYKNLIINGRNNDANNEFYVTQFVLTFNFDVNIDLFTETLKKWSNEKLSGSYSFESALSRAHTNDKEHGVNIVIADFMNVSKVRSVVKLNYKD